MAGSKNVFIYRSRNTSGTNSVGSGSGVRQPPISRPTSSNSSSIGSAASSGGSSLLNSLMNNSTSGCLSNGLAQGIAATLASTQNGGLQNGHAVTVNGHGGSVQSHSAVGNGLKEFLLEQQHLVSYISDHSRNYLFTFSLVQSTYFCRVGHGKNTKIGLLLEVEKILSVFVSVFILRLTKENYETF